MAETELKHGKFLGLARCPHCQISRPALARQQIFDTTDHEGWGPRRWGTYICGVCGGVVLAVAHIFSKQYDRIGEIERTFPGWSEVDAAVPERARDFLTQARETLHAPDGAVMLAASAVDAMLKEKKYKAGSLYSRIDKAATDSVITKDMAKWAHQVRLDANDPRHADEKAPPHDIKSASRAVEFAKALAEFMFVLPARVTRGVNASAPKSRKRAKKTPPK